MLARHPSRPLTGVRRLQQPHGVVSSTIASKLRPGPLKLPGCQRWNARSRATSWNGTSNSFHSNNSDVNGYPAGAAGSNSSSGFGSGPSTAGAAAWPAGTPSSFTPSPASTWEEEGSSSSGWQDYQGTDWGTTTLPGDWGEVGSSTAAAQPHTGTQQQQQQQQAGQQYGYAAADSSAFNGSFDQQQYDQQQQQQQQASDGRWPFADSTFQQQQQPGGAAGVRSPVLPSDITLLGRRDADSMLPLFPSPEQARFYQPRTVPERLVQVLGSFGLSVALSKSAVLAGPALLFPIWGPWVRAGVRNVQLYLRQFTCVGLWRSEVLSVRVNTVPYAYRDPTGTLGDTLTVTVGDPWQGGAATQLTFPYQTGCEDIVEGEPAELLVLSQDDSFLNFKVVREVYLPQSGMWLSEYPFVDREGFLDVSLAIERGRQAATGGATAAGGTMPPAPPAPAAAGVQQPYRPAPMYSPPGFAPAGFAAGSSFAAAGYTGAPGFMPTAYSDQPAGSGLPYAAGSPAAYAAAASGGVAYSSMPFTAATPPSWGYPGVGIGGGLGGGSSAAAVSTPPYQAGYGSSCPTGVLQGLMGSAAAAGANGSSSREGADPAAAGSSSNGSSPSTAASPGTQEQGSSSSSWGDNVPESSSSAAWSVDAAGGSTSYSSTSQAGSDNSSNRSSSGAGSWHFHGQTASQSGMGVASMPGYGDSSSSSSSGLRDPASFAMDLVEDVADAATGVVSNVAGAATGVVSNVAGAATGVAAGVADAATGVAASVAAGFGGWFSAADGSSSSSSGGGSDTAVVPDVIIEGPGTYWSPGGYGAGSNGGYYGSSAYGSNGYMDSRPWAQQQQQQQPGAGFGSVYSGNDPAVAAAGYGGRWYEGYADYSQGAASPGGFSGWSSSRRYGDTAYPGSSSSSTGGGPYPGQGAAGYAGYSSGPTAANSPYSWPQPGPVGGTDSSAAGSNADAASGARQQEQDTQTWRVDSAAAAAGSEGGNSSSPQQPQA